MNTEISIELPGVVLGFIDKIFNTILNSALICEFLLQNQEMRAICSECGFDGGPRKFFATTAKEIMFQTTEAEESVIRLMTAQWKLVYVVMCFTRSCFGTELESIMQGTVKSELTEVQCRQMQITLALVLDELEIYIFGSPENTVLQ